MKKIILISLVCIASGCTTVSGDGGIRKAPGSYVLKVSKDCAVSVDSTTIKGGPGISVHRAEGGCSVEIRHNPSVSEIESLINLLGGA